ncbi:hypothetical protein BVC80_8967g27 [Macleaya cordata]|uniref:Uncharacterized protein n=1 Tax=Macleaya cordata TaxID=56857 RepID=A0A200PLZ9_MACCD|nr:hypothetical protein BVC80_8967g27 [Macleaya cordata]
MPSNSEVMTRGSEGHLHWDLGYSRRRVSNEEVELNQILQQFTLSTEGDARSWRWEKNGQFSVSSCYHAY